MLVLRRKPNQTIVLTGGIVITQLEGGRIGIEAPAAVAIVRGECQDSQTATPDEPVAA